MDLTPNKRSQWSLYHLALSQILIDKYSPNVVAVSVYAIGMIVHILLEYSWERWPLWKDLEIELTRKIEGAFKANDGEKQYYYFSKMLAKCKYCITLKGKFQSMMVLGGHSLVWADQRSGNVHKFWLYFDEHPQPLYSHIYENYMAFSHIFQHACDHVCDACEWRRSLANDTHIYVWVCLCLCMHTK